jgi:hypothetical protein
VRALAVGARYRGAVHAGGAHLTEGYLLRAGESGHAPGSAVRTGTQIALYLGLAGRSDLLRIGSALR